MLTLNYRSTHRMNDSLYQNQHHNQPRPLNSRPLNKTAPLIKAALLAASFGLCLGSTSVSAETFYKWIDKDGSTHYTQTPPTKKGAKATKKVFIDNMAPTTPTPAPNTANTNNPNGQPATNQTSNMDSNQLATAANNGAVPSSAPQTTLTSITAPPAGGLITPDQSQIRPAFSEPAR